MSYSKIIWIELITLLLTIVLVNYTYQMRGYFAIGGEWLIAIMLNVVLLVKYADRNEISL